MIVNEDFYLEHYGVPGMKWGKSRAKTSSPLKKRSAPKSKSSKAKSKNGKVVAAKILNRAAGALFADIVFGSVFGFQNTISGRTIAMGKKQADKILFKAAVNKTIKSL